MPTKKSPEQEASRIIHDLKLGGKLPIDLERAATALKVALKYEPFDEDLSGVLVKGGNRVVIGVNSTHAVRRQRFTVAHELGHFVLGHAGEVFVDKTLRHQTMVIRRDGKSSLGVDTEEIEANRFAAELLMPPKLVSEQVSKRIAKRAHIAPEEMISELADVFQVSQQAMEIRLTNLGYLIPR